VTSVKNIILFFNTWGWPIEAETCSVLKIFIKWQVLKTLLSVLNIDKPHKDVAKKVKERVCLL
jgi:hypothetical protein